MEENTINATPEQVTEEDRTAANSIFIDYYLKYLEKGQKQETADRLVSDYVKRFPNAKPRELYDFLTFYEGMAAGFDLAAQIDAMAEEDERKDNELPWQS